MLPLGEVNSFFRETLDSKYLTFKRRSTSKDRGKESKS